MTSSTNLAISKPQAAIYFPNNHTVTPQHSGLCYYFSFLHQLAFYGKNLDLPTHVHEIISKIREKYTEDYANDQAHNIVLEVTKRHKDELTQLQQEALTLDLDDDEDWVDALIDEYGFELVIAKMLGLTINNFDKNKFSIDWLESTLTTQGPIGLSLISYIDLTNEAYVEKSSITRHIHDTNNVKIANLKNVDSFYLDGGHYCVVIGYQRAPEQHILFIDPNYPDLILSASLTTFKSIIHMPEYTYYQPSSLTLQPIIILSDSNNKKRKHMEDTDLSTTEIIETPALTSKFFNPSTSRTIQTPKSSDQIKTNLSRSCP